MAKKSIYKVDFSIDNLTMAEQQAVFEAVIKKLDFNQRQDLHITITDSAKELILEKGYDIKYGARPLKRAIRSLVEDKLSRLSIEGKITEGCNVIVDTEDKEIVVDVK